MTPLDTNDLHPGMMGDGTEEQNLGQTGNPSARITEGEVEEAFLSAPAPAEPRSFLDSERLSILADKVSAARDQVQQSAEAAKDWTIQQARVARVTASRKPVLVLSVSAGAALAIGLGIGFLVGRAIED